LEIVDIDLHLDDFWSEAPEGYFIAKNVINNTEGTYWLSATVKGNHTGFEGTRSIVTITFHVIYSPCWNINVTDRIWFCSLTLLNNDGECGEEIFPEYVGGATYDIKPPKPVLALVDANDGDHHVIIHKNNPQTTFDVDVWLYYGIKVEDFRIEIWYNATQLGVVGVIMGDYLKPPFTKYTILQGEFGPGPHEGKGYVFVEVVQEGPPQGAPLQNCSGILFTIRFKVIQSIFYHICGISGPKELESNITIHPSSRISAKCPEPVLIWPDRVDLMYTYNPLIGDVDYDGEVTVLDLQLVADHYCTSLYDITGDGHTDIKDLAVVALNFGKTAPPPG
jgi:hypothetical protein